MDVSNTYGVKIVGSGGDQGAAEFKKVENAAKSAHSSIEQGSGRTAGALERLAGSLARSSNGAMMLLRGLGPIGGESVRLAEQLERVALRAEKIGVSAAQSASMEQVLQKAFQEGRIAAASVEAVQAKLSATRQAATAIEGQYIAAQNKSLIAHTDLKNVQAAISQQTVNIAAGRANLANIEGRLAAGMKNSNLSLNEYNHLIQQSQAQEKLLAQSSSNLLSLRQQGVALTSATKAATAEEQAIKKTLAATNKEVAETQTLLNVAQKAASGGFSLMAIGITGIIVVLGALATGIAAVKLAWDSMKEASKHQADEFNLKFLIGDAEVARDRLKEMNEFWQQSGIFAHSDLTQAEKQLLLIGTGTEDLTVKLKEMSAVAAASGESVAGTVSAYQRLREAVIKGMDIPLRGGGSTGLLALLKAVEAETGLTESGVHRLFKTAKDSGVDVMAIVDRSLQHAAQQGGIFFDAITEKQHTWEGATKTLGTAWEGIKERIGAPLIDKFTPMLLSWADKLQELDPQVEAVMTQITEAIKNGRFGELLASAFHGGVESINSYFETKFHELMHNVFYDLPKAEWTAFVEWAKTVPVVVSRVYAEGSKVTWSDIGAGFSAGITAAAWGGGGKPTPPPGATYDWGPGSQPITGEQFELPHGPGGGFDMNRFQRMGTPTVPGEFMGKTGKGSTKESDWAKYEDDLTKINQMWEEMSIIQSKVGDETERNRRINELFASTAKDLTNPTQLMKYVDGLKAEGVVNAQLLIQEQARLKTEKQIDEQIRIGAASVSTSLVRGAKQAAEAWGNLDQQMSKAAGDITNALSSDITQGLTDILSGTKSVSEGFREMALSIIKDIEQIIIKMLVQLAIQKLIGGLSGGGAGGAYGVGAVINQGGVAPGYAFGGFTGEHAKTSVAGVVHGGEYVFTKEQVDKLGLPFLTKLAASAGYQSGGSVHGNPYGIGNPPGSAILPPESYPHGVPPGYTTSTAPVGYEDTLPPAAIGVKRGPAYLGNVSERGGVGGVYISGSNIGQNIPLNDLNVSPTVSNTFYGATVFAGNVASTTATGYPVPGGGAGGPMAPDWAVNAAHNTMVAPYGFGPNYVDPRAANMSAFGLHDWNRSMWAANPRGREGGIFEGRGAGWQSRHNIGAAGARFGMSGRHSGATHMPSRFFYEGGFVDWPRWHSGGMASDETPVIVQKGETILPRGAGNVNQTQVTLSVNFNGDGARGARQQSGRGGDQESAVELERLVVPVIEKWAVKNKRQGGILHSSTDR